MATKKTSVKVPSLEKSARSSRKRVKPVDQDIQEPAVFTLDFPRPQECVASFQYTLRFTAPPDAVSLEVSIDESPWKLARFAVGHWWYDWSGYDTGTHRLRARLLGPTGQEDILERICLVTPPDPQTL